MLDSVVGLQDKVMQLQQAIITERQQRYRLCAAVREVRLYAGDNLPASTGLTIVTMLEKALEESNDGT